jgi:hypothetical protein
VCMGYDGTMITVRHLPSLDAVAATASPHVAQGQGASGHLIACRGLVIASVFPC